MRRRQFLISGAAAAAAAAVDSAAGQSLNATGPQTQTPTAGPLTLAPRFGDALGANYLLNVGPRPDGVIPEEAAAILRRIGRWRASVGEAFERTVPASNLTSNRNVLLTRDGNTLYVHLHRDPVADSVTLKPLRRLPARATLLNTGRPVACAVDMAPSDHLAQAAYLRLTNLPANELSNTVMVVKLEFDGDPAS